MSIDLEREREGEEKVRQQLQPESDRWHVWQSIGNIYLLYGILFLWSPLE